MLHEIIESLMVYAHSFTFCLTSGNPFESNFCDKSHDSCNTGFDHRWFQKITWQLDLWGTRKLWDTPANTYLFFGGTNIWKAYLQEASISGNCYRVNPEGKLRGKGGDYGKMRLIFFADLNDYRFNYHPASCMHSMHELTVIAKQTDLTKHMSVSNTIFFHITHIHII